MAEEKTAENAAESPTVVYHEKPNRSPDCTLKESVRSEEKCNPQWCKYCGWNCNVVAERQKLLDANGLEQGPNGTARLVIPERPGQTGMSYEEWLKGKITPATEPERFAEVVDRVQGEWITQLEAANECGVSKSTFSRWMRKFLREHHEEGQA